MFWPCETRTSTCRSFATISSGLYRFLAIAVLLDVKDIPQVGPLQWGWIRLLLQNVHEAQATVPIIQIRHQFFMRGVPGTCSQTEPELLVDCTVKQGSAE